MNYETLAAYALGAIAKGWAPSREDLELFAASDVSDPRDAIQIGALHAIEKAFKWVHEKNLAKLGYVRVPGATGTKPAKGGGNLVLARKGSELRDKAERLGLNKKAEQKPAAQLRTEDKPKEMTPEEKEIADTVAEHKSRDMARTTPLKGESARKEQAISNINAEIKKRVGSLKGSPDITDERSAIEKIAMMKASYLAGKKDTAARDITRRLEILFPGSTDAAHQLLKSELKFTSGYPDKGGMKLFTTADLGKKAQARSFRYNFPAAAKMGWFTDGVAMFKVGDADAKRIAAMSTTGPVPNLSYVLRASSGVTQDVSVTAHRNSRFHDKGDMKYELSNGDQVSAIHWNTISRRFPNARPMINPDIGAVFWMDEKEPVAALMVMRRD